MPDPSVADSFLRLVDLMARLRGPDGCPWDREQTPESLRPYVIEEAYEVLEAIERGDPEALRDELGDLLLQVVFQAQLATEAGRFTIADVANAVTDKLVRRHPHVFGDVEVRDADEVMRNWRRIKAEERHARGAPGPPAASRRAPARAARRSPTSTPPSASACGPSPRTTARRAGTKMTPDRFDRCRRSW